MSFSNTEFSRNNGLSFKPLQRSVSIIGSGQTPFGYSELTEGMTERELGAWAAQLAMVDAGITAKDIQATVLSQAASAWMYNTVAPNVYQNDYIGMRGKPNYHHEEACCTSAICIEDATTMIASGKYDMVLVLGTETDAYFSSIDQPNYVRYNVQSEWEHHIASGKRDKYIAYIMDLCFDSSYSRYFAAQNLMEVDESTNLYMEKYGVSFEDIQKAVNRITINDYYNASINPLVKGTMAEKNIADLAAEVGLTEDEYINSDKYNRWYTPTHRHHAYVRHGMGAGALILYASELAHKYTDRPVEILGAATSSCTNMYPFSHTRMKEESLRMALGMSGKTGADMDILYCTDFAAGEQLMTADISGYIPEGQVVKYVIDGETAIDGSRPINVHGGCLGMGHAFGVQAFEYICDCIIQMRGEAGKRQVKKTPKLALINLWGANQNCGSIVLEAKF